ncbi:MAG: transglycosylase SLT domain-containing protein, partial [Bacteroidetes bacterium]|nr:transglycosylase SLT domain-containing protein [Bacteroidota bacterium]
MKKKYRTRMRRDPGTEWLFYPKYYEEMVKQYGHWYSLDEAFVFALIKNESAFRTYSVSRAQAIGLMQIMPFT